MANKTNKLTIELTIFQYLCFFFKLSLHFTWNLLFLNQPTNKSKNSQKSYIMASHMPVHWYSYSINVMVHRQRKNKIHKALMGKVGQRKASSDRTHQFPDNPPDEGSRHIVLCRRGTLCRVLHGEHGSNTHVAGVISLAKLTESSRIPMLFPDRASAQGLRDAFPRRNSQPLIF